MSRYKVVSADLCICPINVEKDRTGRLHPFTKLTNLTKPKRLNNYNYRAVVIASNTSLVNKS